MEIHFGFFLSGIKFAEKKLYWVILDKWIVTSNLIGRRVSCDESLFSDNDSVRVGCSNDNVMTTTGEFYF